MEDLPERHQPRCPGKSSNVLLGVPRQDPRLTAGSMPERDLEHAGREVRRACEEADIGKGYGMHHALIRGWRGLQRES